MSVNDHDFEDAIHSQSNDMQAAADAVHDFHCTSAVASEQRIIGVVDQFCHRQVIGIEQKPQDDLCRLLCKSHTKHWQRKQAWRQKPT